MKTKALLALAALSFSACGGGLAPLDGSAVPSSAATAPRYLVAGLANGSQHRLMSYAIGASAGALTQVGAPVTANASYVLAPSADGRFVVAVGGTQAQSFAVDRATGALSAVNTVTLAGANLTFAAFHASGSFVFATDGTAAPAAKIYTLSVDPAGALALAATLTSATVPALDYPHGVALTPDGAYLYVANYAGGIGAGDKVLGFSVNAATGGLTHLAGSPFAGGLAHVNDARNLVVSADGRHVYVVDETSSPTRTSHFTLNPATGALAIAGSAAPPSGLAGGGVALSGDGRFAFSTSRFGDEISAFAVGAGTGDLTYASALTTGLASPISLAAHPELAVIYCANSASNAISVLGYAASGALTNFTGFETLVPGAGYTVDAVALLKLAP